MSDENRFFRWVWRFNGIVLALFVTASAFMLGHNLWRMLVGEHQEWGGPSGHFVPVPKSAEENFTYRLATDRSPVVLVHEEVFSLMRWKGEPQAYGLADNSLSSSDNSEMQEVNRLAVDAEGSAGHWLFRGYERIILTENTIDESMPESAGSTGPQVIRAVPAQVATPVPAMGAHSATAIVLETVDADTDKDGKLTVKDRHSLYVYRAGAVEAVKFISADSFLSLQQMGADKYLVIYENGKTAAAATFSLPDLKLLSDKSLPNVPK